MVDVLYAEGKFPSSADEIVVLASFLLISILLTMNLLPMEGLVIARQWDVCMLCTPMAS